MKNVSTPPGHRAAVVSDGAVYYGDGTTVRAARGLAENPAAILAGTEGRFGMHCTVVVDGVTPDAHSAHSRAVERAGWKSTTVGAWTLYHAGDRTVAVGLRAAMRPNVHLGLLVNAGDDPGALAVRMDRYAQVTGWSWRGTAATTGLAALRLSWGKSRSQPLWDHGRSDVGRVVGKAVGAYHAWSRPLNWAERDWGYLHTFDANNAYLGAAINADLAWDALHHAGAQSFDPNLPGYWHLRLDDDTLAWHRDPNRPPLVSRIVDGCAWVTTPVAKLLGELGDRLEVLDSYTAQHHPRHPAGSRVTRGWGEQLRDALVAVDQYPPGTMRDQLRTAVKRTYKDSIGGMQRAGMRVDRADWGHTIVDHWRATLYRRMLHVRKFEGVWPVAIATDAITYADDVAYPETIAATIGVRAGLGGWKLQDSTPINGRNQP